MPLMRTRVPKFYTLFFRLLRTTTKYPAADLVTLAETLLRIVLHAELNVPVMVRTSKLLSKVRLCPCALECRRVQKFRNTWNALYR